MKRGKEEGSRIQSFPLENLMINGVSQQERCILGHDQILAAVGPRVQSPH